MYDTLYRYFVLFGFPSDEDNSENWGAVGSQFLWADNPVWCALLECLLSENNGIEKNMKSNNNTVGKRGGRGSAGNNRKKSISEKDKKLRLESRNCFSKDHSVWGIHTGSHSIMIR